MLDTQWLSSGQRGQLKFWTDTWICDNTLLHNMQEFNRTADTKAYISGFRCKTDEVQQWNYGQEEGNKNWRLLNLRACYRGLQFAGLEDEISGAQEKKQEFHIKSFHSQVDRQLSDKGVKFDQRKGFGKKDIPASICYFVQEKPQWCNLDQGKLNKTTK